MNVAKTLTAAPISRSREYSTCMIARRNSSFWPLAYDKILWNEIKWPSYKHGQFFNGWTVSYRTNFPLTGWRLGIKNVINRWMLLGRHTKISKHPRSSRGSRRWSTKKIDTKNQRTLCVVLTSGLCSFTLHSKSWMLSFSYLHYGYSFVWSYMSSL
jgi:hypothetical protein